MLAYRLIVCLREAAQGDSGGSAHAVWRQADWGGRAAPGARHLDGLLLRDLLLARRELARLGLLLVHLLAEAVRLLRCQQRDASGHGACSTPVVALDVCAARRQHEQRGPHLPQLLDVVGAALDVVEELLLLRRVEQRDLLLCVIRFGSVNLPREL